MSDLTPQMEADIARVTKLAETLMLQMYEESESRGETNFRIDQIGIVGVAAWTREDDEGEEREVEDGFSAFESRKHHVVTGILADILAARFQRN